MLPYIESMHRLRSTRRWLTGRQHGTWTAAEQDPQQNIAHQFIRTPSSTTKRRTGLIPEEVYDSIQKLVKAELEREAVASQDSAGQCLPSIPSGHIS